MGQPQIIEGNFEEIKHHIQNHEAELIGHKLLLVIDPSEPANTIRDLSHLKELLHEGMQGDLQPLTADTWQKLYDRIDKYPQSVK